MLFILNETDDEVRELVLLILEQVRQQLHRELPLEWVNYVHVMEQLLIHLTIVLVAQKNWHKQSDLNQPIHEPPHTLDNVHLMYTPSPYFFLQVSYYSLPT